MKMLLISNMYPSTEQPSYGVFVKNFEEQMLSEGFKIDKVVIHGKGLTKVQKIFKYIVFFFNIYNILIKNKYDIIYVHYMAHSLLPFVPIIRFIKIPFVLNAHGGDVMINTVSEKIIKFLVMPVIRKASLIVVPSLYFMDCVMNEFGIATDRIFVSPSGGINLSLFQPSNIVESKSNIFTIGYVSRIDKGKGWDVLLDAIHLLKQKGYIFKVLVIGGGSEVSLLIAKVQELMLNDEVEHIGVKSHSELPYYFHQMDIFVFPTTLNESLGLVGLEAMACAIPVIGSNIGGLRGYIQNDFNGQLFEVGNYIKLVEKIELFLSMDQKKYCIYKKNALETAKSYNALKIKKLLFSKIKESVKK